MIGMRLFASIFLIFAWLVPAPVEARCSRLDFLDERLPIPESKRFVESEYTNSRVGLSYGIDKQLSYLAVDYEAATTRFESAISKFKHKSEIWVCLSRAYFFKKEPDRAKEALLRAAAAMPDLREIRQTANKLQV